MERLVSELVDDALELIAAAQDLDLDDARADALRLLALVAGQDTEPGDGPGRWRIAWSVAAGRVLSVVDPEPRHAHNSSHSYRDGYKTHICAEPGTGLVTAVGLTPGNTADAKASRGCSKTSWPGLWCSPTASTSPARCEPTQGPRHDSGDQAAAFAHRGRRWLQHRRLRPQAIHHIGRHCI